MDIVCSLKALLASRWENEFPEWFFLCFPIGLDYGRGKKTMAGATVFGLPIRKEAEITVFCSFLFASIEF